MAYRISTPSSRLSMGTKTTPPPRPVSAPRKPAISEPPQTSKLNSRIVMNVESLSHFACDARLTMKVWVIQWYGLFNGGSEVARKGDAGSTDSELALLNRVSQHDARVGETADRDAEARISFPL